MKKTNYILCTCLPLFIFALFVSKLLYSEPPYRSFIKDNWFFIIECYHYAIILSIFQILFVLGLKRYFVIVSSKKIITATIICSYFTAVFLLSSFITYPESGLLVFSLPLLLIAFIFTLDKIVCSQVVANGDLKDYEPIFVIIFYVTFALEYYFKVFSV